MNYHKIYKQLVEEALKANTDPAAYYEKHHILPRSMGGADTLDNLVPFTPRQHFIAHLLLERMTRGTPEHYKMLKAVYIMSNGSRGHTARLHEKIRVQHHIQHKLSIHRKQYGEGVFRATGLYQYYKDASVSKRLIKTLKDEFKIINKKDTIITTMLIALCAKGVREVSGIYFGNTSNVDNLSKVGLLIKKGAGCNCTFVITEDLIELHNRCVVQTPLQPLYRYLSHYEAPSRRNCRAIKAECEEFNRKCTDGNLKRVIYINKEYYLI
jgi:hypothetical protein